MNALIQANLRNVQAIRRKLGKIDLIHAHVSYPAGFISHELSRQLDIPFVLTEHMSPFPFPAYQRAGCVIPEIRQALNSASRIIAVSPSHAAHIAGHCDRTIDVIPNLVDETQFRPLPYASKGPFRFLTMGVGPQKGTDLLLEAISLWRPDPAKVEFLIGGGTESQLLEYQALCQEFEIASLVRWLGPVPRHSVAQVFGSCDAFVMPSRTESFGISYVEALACGRPVIATKCGGPEWFVNESNGMLVDAQSGLDELICAMKYMTVNARQFQTEKIRSEFESRFSRQAVVSQISRIYREVVGEAPFGGRDGGAVCAA
jgi:glycosyltransferase involved in cell wall biosynthesis